MERGHRPQLRAGSTVAVRHAGAARRGRMAGLARSERCAGCRRHGRRGALLAAGADELPAQRPEHRPPGAGLAGERGRAVRCRRASQGAADSGARAAGGRPGRRDEDDGAGARGPDGCARAAGDARSAASVRASAGPRRRRRAGCGGDLVSTQLDRSRQPAVAVPQGTVGRSRAPRGRPHRQQLHPAAARDAAAIRRRPLSRHAVRGRDAAARRREHDRCSRRAP